MVLVMCSLKNNGSAHEVLPRVSQASFRAPACWQSPSSGAQSLRGRPALPYAVAHAFCGCVAVLAALLQSRSRCQQPPSCLHAIGDLLGLPRSNAGCRWKLPSCRDARANVVLRPRIGSARRGHWRLLHGARTAANEAALAAQFTHHREAGSTAARRPPCVGDGWHLHPHA